METQYRKIFKLHKEKGWVCGNEYRREFIFSSHKRRQELSERYGVSFQWKPCEHGHRQVRDYFLVQGNGEVKKTQEEPLPEGMSKEDATLIEAMR